jgi:hypothetical protein
MSDSRTVRVGTEVKIFDPRDASTGSDGAELVDASIAQRGEQWWMYLAGQPHGLGVTDVYSALLPLGVVFPLPAGKSAGAPGENSCQLQGAT